MDRELIDLALDENDVKEILDDHGKRLEDHDKKIVELQVKSAGFEERFNSIDDKIEDIKTTLNRMETSNLQNMNSMMGAMTQVIINTSRDNAEVEKTKSINNKDVMLRILGIVAVVVGGYFALKGVHIVG
jgi:predicted nuclease with TOPRIM domain